MAVVGFAALLLGGIFGYFVGKRPAVSRNREVYLLHEGMERQARAYFHFLQASDSSRPEEPAKLRRQALAVLTVYTREVDDLRAEYGFDSGYFDKEFYTTAKAYLAEHPIPAKE